VIHHTDIDVDRLDDHQTRNISTPLWSDAGF
jgi:hypothetical protein